MTTVIIFTDLESIGNKFVLRVLYVENYIIEI